MLCPSCSIRSVCFFRLFCYSNVSYFSGSYKLGSVLCAEGSCPSRLIRCPGRSLKWVMQLFSPLCLLPGPHCRTDSSWSSTRVRALPGSLQEAITAIATTRIAWLRLTVTRTVPCSRRAWVLPEQVPECGSINPPANSMRPGCRMTTPLGKCYLNITSFQEHCEERENALF